MNVERETVDSLWNPIPSLHANERPPPSPHQSKRNRAIKRAADEKKQREIKESEIKKLKQQFCRPFRVTLNLLNQSTTMRSSPRTVH